MLVMTLCTHKRCSTAVAWLASWSAAQGKPAAVLTRARAPLLEPTHSPFCAPDGMLGIAAAAAASMLEGAMLAETSCLAGNWRRE
ncbi:hypothetical protein WJX75_003446 [Coccomyxa subellipsoidea]|uniref:Secreted protein n=1 Tax=Coccomyxa subellipsoidea TaxID=248742 RepID=A0ABR2YAI6_9CHLO